MIITREDLRLENIKIPLHYGEDAIRIKNKSINLNKYLLSGVSEIKIENKLILFLDGESKEILRTRVEDISDINIDEIFGVYVINKF